MQRSLASVLIGNDSLRNMVLGETRKTVLAIDRVLSLHIIFLVSGFSSVPSGGIL